MANEALEIVWHSLLGFVVPDLDHVVFTSSNKVSSVKRHIQASNASSMAISNLSQEDTFILHEAVESHFAVLGNNEEISVVVGELEGAHYVVYHYLMLKKERFGIINHNVVAILAHNSKPW